MRLSQVILSVCMIAALFLVSSVHGDETEKLVTTARGELGNLLRQWHKEGSAAGNTGDYYDNRDRGHSGLRMGPYPQLQKITYTQQQLRRRRDWAAQRVIIPHVVMGNSSTSAHMARGGSNVRMYYSNPRGIKFLYTQYTHNNIYIYPEHRDYDPGRNGLGGYGDLYPTNSPYLITSQGSSGSDQSFMRAIPFVLAAFQPETKKKLIDSGLIAPTLQMILRMSNKNITDPKEYLTGKAHPTVFLGRNVDSLKMIKMAHKILATDIPPMIQLKAVIETTSIAGLDYFDLRTSERLADTPAVIARIARGKNRSRKITVSAEASYDVNKRPLKFHWVVLRGDPKLVKITPQNATGSQVEITVAYHPRRPIAKDSKMESNRVDIGAFVHNGKYFSAPGFVTFYYPDSEARTYDKNGRLLEIGYNASTSALKVSDWTALFAILSPGANSWPATLLAKQFSSDELAVIGKVGDEYKTVHATLLAASEKSTLAAKTRNADRATVKAAKKKLADASNDKNKATLAAAEKAAKESDAKFRTARGVTNRARQAENKVLDKVRTDLKLSVRALVDRAFARLVNDADLYLTHQKKIAPLRAKADAKSKAALDAERKYLAAFGMLKKKKGGKIEFLTLQKERLTAYEQCMRTRLNAVVLANVIYPDMIGSSCKVNFVDPAIFAPKSWRDVYHYDATGTISGWTRYDEKQTSEFTADGRLILKKNFRGRPVKTRKITYSSKPPKRGQRGRGELQWTAAGKPPKRRPRR